MKKLIILFIAGISSQGARVCVDMPSLSRSEIKSIGQRVWKNECAGKVIGLTSWNEREEFASLGIGHFIWYPRGLRKSYTETFPELISFFKKKGISMPSCVLSDDLGACPWASREEFLNDLNSPCLVQLRELLSNTVDIQAEFIVNKSYGVLERLLASTSSCHEKEHLKKQFYRVAASPGGTFALIDYINFKGEGVSGREQYNDHAWGLKQVLLSVTGDKPGRVALEEFVVSAKKVLSQRVTHAPVQRHEERWIPGWYARLDGYLA